MRPAAALLALLLFCPGPAAGAPDLSQDAILRGQLWRELLAKPKEQRPTVGLVLSAGSLRATAHVGVIAVLENAGFPIDVVAGTSMGAVIGALYAGGRPAKRLWEIALSMTFSSGSNYSKVRLLSLLLSDKLLSSEGTVQFINAELGGLRFEQLPKPFACVAMDIYTGEAIIFREGELAPAVRASMNLPGLFEPVQYRQRYLVDGGVVDYIPIDAAKLLGADWVLASITENDYRAVKPKSVFESLEQVIDIRGAFLSREQRKQANFLIEPAVGEIGMFQAARANEAMSKGVIAANNAVKAAMESLLLFSMGSLSRGYGPEPKP
ncbi:MAG: patatin-like phospholipase family protein [Elusimicrobiota bacterium]